MCLNKKRPPLLEAQQSMERATGLGAASPRKRCGPCGPLRAALEKCSRTFLSSAPAIGFESMECAQTKKTPIAGSLTIAGAGDGIRTRGCQHGKLGPYHLATPACVFAGSTSVGDSIPCQFSRDKASPRKRTRSARKRLTRQPSRPCPCSGSRAPHSSTVCTRHRGRRCTTGSRARG